MHDLRLNGWQRLWVVLTLAWTLAVATYVYTTWPVAHPAAKDTARVYEVTAPDGTVLELDLKGAKTLADGLHNTTKRHLEGLVQQRIDAGEREERIGAFIRDYTVAVNKIKWIGIEMPTGPIEIEVGASVSKLAGIYDAMLADDLRQRRIHLLVLTLPWWILPPVLLYAVGWIVRWVYRGFKPASA